MIIYFDYIYHSIQVNQRSIYFLYTISTARKLKFSAKDFFITLRRFSRGLIFADCEVLWYIRDRFSPPNLSYSSIREYKSTQNEVFLSIVSVLKRIIGLFNTLNYK